MGNFDRNKGSGGHGGYSYRGRGGGKPGMHPATCADCGSGCEVPFKPNGKKPVFCSNCFQGGDGSRSGGRGGSDRSGGSRFGGRGSERPRFEERRMFQAACADCGDRCEVPFRPTGEKPVYCSECFGDSKSRDFFPGRHEPSNEQFEQLNKKLDKILKILDILHEKKTFVIEKIDREEIKREEVEEAPVKKKISAGKTSKPKKTTKTKTMKRT